MSEEQIESDEFDLCRVHYIIVLHTNDECHTVEMFPKGSDLHLVCKVLRNISKESAGTFMLYDDPIPDERDARWIVYRSSLLCCNGKSRIYDDEYSVTLESIKEDYERINRNGIN